MRSPSVICMLGLLMLPTLLSSITPSIAFPHPMPPSDTNGPHSTEIASKDQLAFGLNRLRWGMSLDQVKAAYPNLKFGKSRGAFSLTNLPSAYIEDYVYKGCTFQGVLRFDQDKLRVVDFGLTSPRILQPPCLKAMKAEFATRYGVPVSYFPAEKSPVNGPWHPFSGEYGNFNGAVTDANFTSVGVAFDFSDAVNKPDITIYDVAEPLPKMTAH